MNANELSATTTANLRDNVETLNAMILGGRMLEAFETFYAEDVVQQENELEPTRGKEANRKREQEFVSKVTEFRSAEVKSVTIDEESDTAMVEWFFDYTHEDWGDRTYHQISVQRWSDGQIVHERYYYGC
ncbi:MAG: nuclear transport factor 2 family protein [Rhodothermales bacterium]|nr:nuclear transport factor 2 family protein [Rhodothermales bacterium]